MTIEQILMRIERTLEARENERKQNHAIDRSRSRTSN